VVRLESELRTGGVAIRARPSHLLLFVFRFGTALSAAVVSILGWTVFRWDAALNISLAILATVITVHNVGSYLWARKSFRAKPDSDIPPTNVWADAAKLSITTQGVVLGLVSFSNSSKFTLTVKVGAAALATGVVVATMLYLLTAGTPPYDQKRAVVATILLSLTLWSLVFGLVCVVAGNWSR
jgi:hypothetical protein